MEMEAKLELKLSQRLILTPQLQQSIKLLLLPQIELSQTLNQELMENPFLEEIIEKEPEEKYSVAEKTDELPQEPAEDIEAPLEKMFGFTTDEYFEERSSDGRDFGYFSSDAEASVPFERDNKKMGLHEYLLWQLRLTRIPSELVGKTAEVIIGNLDGDGYLQASLEEIARLAETDIETAESALSLVWNFDPPGVGARNLQECLLLQLRPLELNNTLVEKILTDGFHELEKKKYKQLANKFKVSVDDILMAAKIIAGLEPRPGRNYSNEDVVYVVPDVYIEEDSEGKFIIMLNDEGIPRLRLSNYYRKLIAKKNTLNQEEKQFLDGKLRAAIWLMKSLEQRNKTIYRVTESILKFQEDFFRKGIKYLKPLNLRDVASDLGMHESTVSRVTSNKYLQCPQGLFDFKFFFSSSVKSANGNVSSAVVKDTIRQLIAKEDPNAPLSDKDLADALKNLDIRIARRTIAKYREELNIPSHRRRGKWS